MSLKDEFRLLVAACCMYLMVRAIPANAEGRAIMARMSKVAKDWAEMEKKA